MAITPFQTRIDKRLVGAEVLIAGDPYTVPALAPYVVHLVEVPLLLVPTKDVTIPGFTRVAGVPGPSQFSVNFSTGDITFDSSAAGASIFVTYWGTGSTIVAMDVNEMHGPINALETEVQTARGSQASLDLRISFAHKASGDIKDNFIKPIHISNTITDNFTFPNDVTVNGDLHIVGNVNKDLSTVITTTDEILLFNAEFTGSPTADCGIEVERGTSPNVFWQWKESPTPSWNFTNSAGSDVLTITDGGNLTVSGNLTVGGTTTTSSSISTTSWIQAGSYTDATEATLVSGWGAPEAGRQWFNTTSSQFKGWNGSSVIILG